MKLSALTSAINQKIASDSVYLNLFTYAGTLTYPGASANSGCGEVLWYVYGSPLIATSGKIAVVQDANKEQATTNVVLTSDFGNNRDRSKISLFSFNNFSLAGTNGGDGNFAAIRLCYTGYVKSFIIHLS